MIDIEGMEKIESTSPTTLPDSAVYATLLQQGWILEASVERGFLPRHADLLGGDGLLKTHQETCGLVIGVERRGAFYSWVSAQRASRFTRKGALEINEACLAYRRGERVSLAPAERIRELGLAGVCDAIRLVTTIARGKNHFELADGRDAAKLYVALTFDD